MRVKTAGFSAPPPAESTKNPAMGIAGLSTW